MPASRTLDPLEPRRLLSVAAAVDGPPPNMPTWDLYVDALRLDATAAAPGQSIPFDARPRFEGRQPWSAVPVAFYLTADATVGNADDVLLGTFDAPTNLEPFRPFQPGLPAADPPRFTATLPASLKPGTYRLAAVIDLDDEHNESDETNNVTFAPTTLSVYRPNVAATLKAATPSATAGAPVPLTLRLTNRTPRTLVNNYALRLYLSSDRTLSPDDLPIAARTVTVTLAPGASRTINCSPRLPVTFPLGGVRFIAVATPTTTGLPNRAVALTIVKLTGSSLAPSVHSIDSVPGNPSSARVTVRLANVGTATTARTASVTLRLFSDSPEDRALVAFARKRPASLRPGHHVDYPFTVARVPDWTFRATVA